jgi:hypothetical protein
MSAPANGELTDDDGGTDSFDHLKVLGATPKDIRGLEREALQRRWKQ